MQVLSFVYIQLNYMYIIRAKKFKSWNKGIRIFLYWGFFCNCWFDKDINIVSHLINIISIRKIKAEHVRCHTSISWWWKIYFYYLIWFFIMSFFLLDGTCHLTVDNLLSVNLYFFPFISLSYLQKWTLILIVISVFDSFILVLIFIFFFIKVLFVFNLIFQFNFNFFKLIFFFSWFFCQKFYS